MAVWAVKIYDEIKGRRSIPKVLGMFNDEDEAVSFILDFAEEIIESNRYDFMDAEFVDCDLLSYDDICRKKLLVLQARIQNGKKRKETITIYISYSCFEFM